MCIWLTRWESQLTYPLLRVRPPSLLWAVQVYLEDGFVRHTNHPHILQLAITSVLQPYNVERMCLHKKLSNCMMKGRVPQSFGDLEALLPSKKLSAIARLLFLLVITCWVRYRAWGRILLGNYLAKGRWTIGRDEVWIVRGPHMKISANLQMLSLFSPSGLEIQ